MPNQNHSDNFLSNYTLQGVDLPIVTFPNPILSKKAKPVTEFNHELRELCKNMLFTMYHAPGVGLAAPQIGQGLRLFVIDVDYDRDEVTTALGPGPMYKLSNFNPRVFINPVIEKSGEILENEEGCLSVPGVYEEVKRSAHVVVKYQDMFGEHHTLEADELLSICLQHENDHLEGLVFLDRLSLLKKNLYKKKLVKAAQKK